MACQRQQGAGHAHCSPQRCGLVTPQLCAQRFEHVDVIGLRPVTRVADRLERPQPDRVVPGRVEQGACQCVECRGRDSGITRIEQGAHGVHGSHCNIGLRVGEQRADDSERPGIADALEHSQEARLVGGVGLGEPLEDLAQGRASDDGEPCNGRLDRHGVVTGQ